MDQKTEEIRGAEAHDGNSGQIEIIFFDIDGTLRDMETGTISDKTIYTLQQLQKNEIRICLCTGRSPAVIPDFGTVVFDALLTYNGSLVFDGKGNALRQAGLLKSDVKQIIANAQKLGKAAGLAGERELFANGWDQDLSDYYAISRVVLERDPDFESKLENQIIYQMMCGVSGNQYQELMEGVQQAEIAAWWPRAVDIIPKGDGKGDGVRCVLEHFGLPQEAAAAFGDGDNDIPMLRACGTGICMANGSARLHEAADCSCPAVGEDGIYQWCVANALIAPAPDNQNQE